MSPGAQWKWYGVAVILFALAAVLPYTKWAKHAATALASGLAVAFFVFVYNAYELAHP